MGLLIFYLRPQQDLAEIARLKEKTSAWRKMPSRRQRTRCCRNWLGRFPDDPFIARNLAVVRLFRFEKQDEKAKPEKSDLPPQPPLPPEQLEPPFMRCSGPSQKTRPAMSGVAGCQVLRDKKIEIDPPLPEPFESLSDARELAPGRPCDPDGDVSGVQVVCLSQKREQSRLAGRTAVVDALQIAPNNLAVFIELLRSQLPGRLPGVKIPPIPPSPIPWQVVATCFGPLRTIVLHKASGE